MNDVPTNDHRKLVALFAILAFSMMLIPPVFAQGKQDFTLVNRSGITINELYVGPTKSDDWGNDILGEGTLDNNRQRNIVFSPRTKAARWDIQIVDENGKKHTKYDLNLLEISEITVRDNGKGDGGWVWSTK
jgi:hypothetical protein